MSRPKEKWRCDQQEEGSEKGGMIQRIGDSKSLNI